MFPLIVLLSVGAALSLGACVKPVPVMDIFMEDISTIKEGGNVSGNFDIDLGIVPLVLTANDTPLLEEEPLDVFLSDPLSYRVQVKIKDLEDYESGSIKWHCGSAFTEEVMENDFTDGAFTIDVTRRPPFGGGGTYTITVEGTQEGKAHSILFYIIVKD